MYAYVSMDVLLFVSSFFCFCYNKIGTMKMNGKNIVIFNEYEKKKQVMKLDTRD